METQKETELFFLRSSRFLALFIPFPVSLLRTRFRSILPEFLTDQTTCASEMLERTPSENFCQKGPAVGGGTPGAGDTCPCRHWGWRHAPSLPPAASVGGGMPLPATCRQWGWRHGPPAASGGGGMAPALPPAASGGGGMLPAAATHARPLRAKPHAGDANGGRGCRQWPRRQGARVACPGGAATHSWSFLTKNFGGGPF
jgi:hypothetical protein